MVWDSFLYSFICSFIQIFIEDLLCTKLCPKHQRYIKKNSQGVCSHEAYILVEEHRKKFK